MSWCQHCFPPSQRSANEHHPQTWGWTNRRAACGHLSCFSHVVFWRPGSAVRRVCSSVSSTSSEASLADFSLAQLSIFCVVLSRRMKYLWTPYVCMFTAFGVCSPDLWMTVFKWLKLKFIHPVVLVRTVYTRLVTTDEELFLLLLTLCLISLSHSSLWFWAQLFPPSLASVCGERWGIQPFFYLFC